MINITKYKIKRYRYLWPYYNPWTVTYDITTKSLIVDFSLITTNFTGAFLIFRIHNAVAIDPIQLIDDMVKYALLTIAHYGVYPDSISMKKLLLEQMNKNI